MSGPFKMRGFSGFGNSPMTQKRMMTKKLKQKVDPDAPGTPGQPGYEPPATTDPNTGEWKGLQVGEGQGHKREGKYKSKQNKPVKPYSFNIKNK
jgi:hypothetical protein